MGDRTVCARGSVHTGWCAGRGRGCHVMATAVVGLRCSGTKGPGKGSGGAERQCRARGGGVGRHARVVGAGGEGRASSVTTSVIAPRGRNQQPRAHGQQRQYARLHTVPLQWQPGFFKDS